MKPLNQPERRTRLWQFSLLYLLALLVPLGASYYLFSNSSIADENVRLKRELDHTHEEQARLITQFDTLTQQLQRINGVDQRIQGEPNQLVVSRLIIKNQDYLNSIAVGLSELRNDTARMQIPAHRALSRDVLRDFDLFRSTRATLDAMREELARRSSDARGNERITAEMNQLRQDNTALKIALSSRPSGGGGGGGAPQGMSLPTPNSSSRLQIELLKDQVAFAEADCHRQRALDHKVRSKERRQLLEQSRTEFIQILQNPATEDLKQSIEKTLEPINVELGREPRFFGLIR